MNALEQLKELRDDREIPGMAEAWQMDAAQYIRDHGPALVELIEAADWFMGRYTDGAARDRLFQAIRKLTEDKPA